jgi:hypothetical protein
MLFRIYNVSFGVSISDLVMITFRVDNMNRAVLIIRNVELRVSE